MQDLRRKFRLGFGPRKIQRMFDEYRWSSYMDIRLDIRPFSANARGIASRPILCECNQPRT